MLQSANTTLPADTTISESKEIQPASLANKGNQQKVAPKKNALFDKLTISWKKFIDDWKFFWTWTYIIDYTLTLVAGLATLVMLLFVPYTLNPVDLNNPDISYAMETDTISVFMSALYSGIPPVIIFLAAQYWLRSWHDLHHAILGMIEAMMAFLVIAEVFHHAAGELRPDFLDRCLPDLNGICTGDPATIQTGRAAFPSGISKIL